MELITVVAVLSVFLAFLAKLNLFSNDGHRTVKQATMILASSLNEARTQAILNNRFVCVAVDISSDYKFRRIVIAARKNDTTWKNERVIILPERNFIMPLNILSTHLDGKDLSPYQYTSESLSINGETATCFMFIFNHSGTLLGEKNAIIAVSYGSKQGEDVFIKPDAPLMGVFIASTGQQFILESRKIIQEVL